MKKYIDVDDFIEKLNGYAITDEDRKFAKKCELALDTVPATDVVEKEKWNSCKDKPIPEERGWYYVTYKNGRVANVLFDGYVWMKKGIIAWMDIRLPKPYREEVKDDDRN